MERKEMVKKLGEFTGVKPKYLGAPSFAYEVAAETELFTIDREGTITTGDGKAITLEEILTAEQPKEMEASEELKILKLHLRNWGQKGVQA